MWIQSIKSLVGSSERVAGIRRSVRRFVSASMFGTGTNLTSPGEERTSLLASVNTGGYAQNLGGASSLAIPSSFDRQVTTRASLALDSTASAQAHLHGGLEHPSATAPLAMVRPPPGPAVCPSVSDFSGGIVPAAHKVFAVVSSHWFASGCPLGVHTHQALTREAGGYAKIAAGASILAIPSSFDCPVTSGASLELESTAIAKAKSPDSVEPPTARNPSAVTTLLSVLPSLFPCG